MPVIAGQNTTRLLSEALRHRQSPVAGPLSTPETGPRGHEHCAWLPEPTEGILARRRAVREFASSAITRSDVLGAIGAARTAEKAVWPPGKHGVLGLDLLIAAFNVDELGRGLYSTRDDSTEPLGPDSGYLEVIREQYDAAPALLLICADVNQACRDAGPSGYAATLVRAGTVGYAAWLWSISAGLAGCVYGGASQCASGAARQLDANLRHLFTVAIGVPADGEGSGGPGWAP
jgi:nitroreductase